MLVTINYLSTGEKYTLKIFFSTNVDYMEALTPYYLFLIASFILTTPLEQYEFELAIAVGDTAGRYSTFITPIQI